MALPPTPRLSGAELALKVQEYERFANDVLKVDLKRAVEARSRALREVDELEELRRTVHVMREERAAATAAGTSPPPLKARVELGPGVYVRARVPDTSRICLAVGLGFHLELTLEEADRAIDLRVAAAQRAADAALDRCASIRANLKFVTEAIRQLLDLP